MEFRSRQIALFFPVLMLAGCATTRVTSQPPPVSQSSAPSIARPDQIWVYDFVASPADVPPDSSIAGDLSTPSTPLTTDQVATGRRLGMLIATNLVTDIQAMGLSAIHAGPDSTPQVGDVLIRGYLVSIEGGSARGTVQRLVIGFGAGTAELDTLVEGYIKTAQGLRRLGSGTLSSTGNRTPGLILPAAVTIATGNPIGLIVVGGLRVTGEVSGRNSLDARAKATADAIAAELRLRFQDRDWIS
jgi:Domain of unknown function (DUF4410)